MTVPVRRKIIGVGPAQGAIKEFEQLARDYEVHMVPRGPRAQVKRSIRELCETKGPFEAAFILFSNNSYAPMDAELLSPLWENGNNVGCFAQCGAGYDNVRVDTFTDKRCWFTNTPDAVTTSTADFTVWLVLSALRATSYCERVVGSGLWHQGLELSTDPAGLTLGVFGMGRIGKDFARKMKVFGVDLLYNTRTRLSPEVEAALSLRYVSKPELLQTADIVCCLCPITDETFHLIDKEAFALMKHGAFFVNSSRGAVVDTDALIEALDSGKIKRAALDVCEGEPHIPAALLGRNNVTITPHVAAYTLGTITRGERDSFNNVRAFLESGAPCTPVNGPF